MESTPIYDRLVDEFKKRADQKQWEDVFATAMEVFPMETFDVTREELDTIASSFMYSLLNTFKQSQNEIYQTFTAEESSLFNRGLMQASILAQRIFNSAQTV